MTLGRCELLGENFAYFPCTSAHGVPLSLLCNSPLVVCFGRSDPIHATNNKPTKRCPDLSIIAPGRWAARMPGRGPLRRSSAPARKKAIVGKSRVEPELLQSPAFVFLLFVNGLCFLGRCLQLSQLSFRSRSAVLRQHAGTSTRRFIWLRLRRAVASVRDPFGFLSERGQSCSCGLWLLDPQRSL